MATNFGTVNSDTIPGTSTADYYSGGGGADSLTGAGGNDSLSGGTGNDTLDGGLDNDALVGGAGTDTILGGDGNDAINGDNYLILNPTISHTYTGVLDGATYGSTSSYTAGSTANTVSLNLTHNIAGGTINVYYIQPNGSLQFLAGVAPGNTSTIAVPPGATLVVEQGGIIKGVTPHFTTTPTNVVDVSSYFDPNFGETVPNGAGDSINAGAGDDTVYGETGNDTIEGGEGSDQVFGGSGNDSAAGGGGSDTVQGGSGDDTLMGDNTTTTAPGNDFVTGGDGNDSILGGAGQDALSGGAGSDYVSGGTGADTISGGGGTDVISGDDGDDVIRGDGLDALPLRSGTVQSVGGIISPEAGSTTAFDGGPGQTADTGEVGVTFTNTSGVFQTVYYIQPDGTLVTNAMGVPAGQSRTFYFPSSGTVNVVLVNYGTGEITGLYTNVTAVQPPNTTPTVAVTAAGNDGALQYAPPGGADTIDGGAGNDSIQGMVGSDSILGGVGLDTIDGGADHDTISGGDGNDSLIGGAGDDSLMGDLGNDSISAGTGADRVLGGDGADSIDGGADGDSLDGGLGNDLIQGRDGADHIDGGAGLDTLDGGRDNDTISGGDDNDSISGGDGDDSLLGDLGNDTISAGAGADTVLGGDGADVIDGGNDNDTLDGGAGNDSILGMDGADNIAGGVGVDTLDGGAGNDSIDGGDDNDSINGGDGSDTLAGDLGNDTINAGAGTDAVLGGEGDDRLFGDGENDTLGGGLGDDLLDGGAGADLNTGGEGFDTFIAGNGDTISDFNTATDDDFNNLDQGDNDFVDLSGFYNQDNLDIYNAQAALAGEDTYSHPLAWLRADQADGTLEISGLTGVPNFTMTIQNGGGAVDADDLTWDNTNVVCFGADALIATDSGQVAAGDLAVGDMVETRDAGVQQIRWIGSRTLDATMLEAHPKLRPIRIRKGALGVGLPHSDLIVSPQHRMLVRSKIAQKMFGTDEVLVAALQLCEIPGIAPAEDLEDVTYVHFLFDAHHIVRANGAETESLFTGEQALKSVGPAAREEIFEIFPELETRTEPPLAVRQLASGRLGRKLAERHLHNRKPLVA